ncbi:CPBP family intramembrane metalloprotease domain-containing protein [Flavobacterium faecale]|uniref:CPBP family intramembrane metalloprotease domain-containing protein n=1 Tax=Flavobacterium faecale TaxID=1355330 RepID=A0A2S1LFT3_9FLAO|nr:CPBP family intramembrane glutamic endopeptidase [Flavobacterium faecale]AWG22613.1 CPBP family intramembrane metalloprotease domain-containing protein [Flavobacterium faecale]
MFVNQGVRIENEFWKYIVGSLAIISASFIGQLPLIGAIFYEVFKNKKPYPTTNQDLMHFFDSNVTLVLILIPSVFAIVGIYLVVKYLHKQTFMSVTTARPKVDWSRVAFSFGLWAVISVITTLISYYQNPANYEFQFDLIPFLGLLVIGTILIPIQTTVEEYVFRGYLMQGFANLSKNRWFPLLLTSLIFGLMHLANPEVSKMGNMIMVYYIGTGLFLGILTLMDDGMELALGFHGANNLIAALLVTSDWSAFQTNSIFKDIAEPEAGIDIILPVVVIYPLLLLIFSRKYQWTNWKEKLTGNTH